MNILFFDTETTGLYSPKKSLDDPEQARLLQLSCKVATDKNELVGDFSTYILPIGSDYYDKGGWKINEKAYETHGISLEKCATCGIPLINALSIFHYYCKISSRLVAHNIRFDISILNCEFSRIKKESSFNTLDNYCTMLESTNILKLPTGGTRKYKQPKLCEAYEFFTGEKMVNAHDASIDTEACRQVYFEIHSYKKRGKTT